MAASKRTLNIPVYDHQTVPDGAVLDGDDVIDVEVLEDEPTIGERVRAGAGAGAQAFQEKIRNARTNGARDAFFRQPADEARAAAGDPDPRVREREAGRARRREEERVRAEQAKDAKQTNAERQRVEREAKSDPLTKLRLDTIQAGETYMESLRRSGILGAGQTKASQRKQLSDLHQIYASMMVLQCVAPLKEGLSSQNVVSALGMAASMWMLSPNFRVQVGNFAGQIGEAIQSKISERDGRKDDKARNRFEKLAARGKGDQLAERWRRRLDRIEHAERGHRLEFTAQSAAMTEIALAEAAYTDMRRPGADRGLIQDRYDTAIQALYGYVDDDNIPREEVARSMRVIVGQRLEKEPGLANVFAETGHGRFVKDEPREVFINGGTERAIVWTGDFVDAEQSRTISSGSFRLRPPMTVDDHRLVAADTLRREMTSASSVAQVNDVLSQYVVAASVGQHPDVLDMIDDPAARRRFGRARTMFDSMTDDGLSADEQAFVYSNAYVDAVERLQEENPELGAAWVAQYGDNWREKVAEDIARFNKMGAAAERAKQHEAHGPGRKFTATPKRSSKQERPAEQDVRVEDIVDAEVVDDEPRYARPAPKAPRAPKGSSARPAADTRRAIEDPVYEADSLEDEQKEREILDGEVVEDFELEAAAARKAILGRAKSTAHEASDSGQSTSAKMKRARVNQSYNEADTGSITGIGSDDAQPLQDVDFELG